MSFQPGTVVDRYLVEEKLGEGGMAVVYRVRHRTLKSRHALKILTMTRADVQARLVQEGQVQASLTSPHVVAVSDVLEIDGLPGLLMELVRGPPLDHWLFNYKPSIDESLTIFRGIVAGVDAAHARGMIHRDLKPGNVLLHVLDEGVRPQVTDFGLAKVAGSDNKSHTRTGSTMGTPAYMPPEQIRDASRVDRRADLYSLGVILYELVCGRPPYVEDDTIELFTKVARCDYPDPKKLNPDLPDHVVACIDALLTPKPQGRLVDCRAILDVLNGKRPVVSEAGELPPSRPLPLTDEPTFLAHSTRGAAIASQMAPNFASLPDLPPATLVSGGPDDEDTTIVPTRSVVLLGGGGLLALSGIGMLAFIVLIALGVVTYNAYIAPTEVVEPVEPVTVEPVGPEPVEPEPVEPRPSPDVAPEPSPRPTTEPAPQPTKPEPVVGPEPVVEPAPVEPEPVVEPRPVRPRPTPVAEPEPSVAMGAYDVARTDGRVENISLLNKATGEFFEPGLLPVGTYEIRVRFTGKRTSSGGSVTILEDKKTTIRCSAVQALCRGN